MTKQEAIELARQEGWTKADAERALKNIDFRLDLSEKDVWIALSKFAGSELATRQRHQAAQKSQVTKTSKEIKNLALDHASKIKDYESNLNNERNDWQQMLAAVYGEAKKFGFNDSMIEKILKQDDAA